LFLPAVFTIPHLVIFAFAFGIAGFLIRPEAARIESPKISYFLALGLVVLWLVWIFRPDLHTHYDYYAISNLFSAELARSGQANSDWAASLDIHNWFMYQQGTAVALDAVEMLWLGSNTNFLPKLLTLLLVLVALFCVAQTSKLGVVLFSTFCAALLYEQTIQFRHHIYIGLILGVAATYLAGRNLHVVGHTLLAAFLVLAKREGLLLAPILMLTCLPSGGRAAKFAIGITGICLLTMLISIGGHSPFSALIQAADKIGALAKIGAAVLDPAFITSIVAVSILTFSPDSRRLNPPLLLFSAVVALIICSSAIMSWAGKWNAGTIERKTMYMLVPLALTMLCASLSIKLSKLNSAGAGALCSLSVYLFAQAHSVKHIWPPYAVEAVDLYRQIIPAHMSLKIGLYESPKGAFEISPCGDIYSSKFSAYKAYLGADIKISATFADLTDRDVILLPRDMPESERQALQLTGSWKRKNIDCGITVLYAPEMAGLSQSETVVLMRRSAQ
jgi:hypothetical protein